MRWRIGVSAVVAGSALLSARAALTQTQPQSPLTDPSLGITVTATRLDEARSSIQPSLGATTYGFTPRTIGNVPLGENAPLNQVLLRAPGVVQDSFGQIHVRGDMGNVQYRLDGVQLPEGLSLFNNILATRYARQLSLVTGALPAQYGLQTAGIVDITVKSGTSDPGADLSITGGSRDYTQPAFSYGGRRYCQKPSAPRMAAEHTAKMMPAAWPSFVTPAISGSNSVPCGHCWPCRIGPKCPA